MWTYASEADALTDALRLSRAMTYKHALAGTGQGGGKAVVMADPRRPKSRALFHALGRFVDGLGGRYVIAEDVGTSVDDMAAVRDATVHVAGLAEGGSGDPSPVTAYGVLVGMNAAVRHRLGRDGLADLKVAVQGLGHVGHALCGHLHEAGAALFVSDLDAGREARTAADFGAKAVNAEAIYGLDVDVFAPCALGGILNDATIPRLRAKIVAGAANNQLEAPRHGAALAGRGILYAPDYVVNAGGVINISFEGADYDADRAMKAHRGHPRHPDAHLRPRRRRRPVDQRGGRSDGGGTHCRRPWRERLENVVAHVLARDERARPNLARLGLHLFHEPVFVVGIVVEDRKALDVGGFREAHGLLPGRVAPADLAEEFLVGVGAVVDQELGALDQAEDVLVGLADDVLGVGDVAHRLAAVLDPVSGRAVGMVERRRANLDARVVGKIERIARFEIHECLGGVIASSGTGKLGVVI